MKSKPRKPWAWRVAWNEETIAVGEALRLRDAKLYCDVIMIAEATIQTFGRRWISFEEALDTILATLDFPGGYLSDE